MTFSKRQTSLRLDPFLMYFSAGPSITALASAKEREIYSLRILKVADSSKTEFSRRDTILEEQGQSNWKTDKTSISSDYFLTQASKKRSMMMMVEESTVGVCEKWNEG